jgi:hypothetical protein
LTSGARRGSVPAAPVVEPEDGLSGHVGAIATAFPLFPPNANAMDIPKMTINVTKSIAPSDNFMFDTFTFFLFLLRSPPCLLLLYILPEVKLR